MNRNRDAAGSLGIVPGERLGKIMLVREFEMRRLGAWVDRASRRAALGHRALAMVERLPWLVDQRRRACFEKLSHASFP